MSPDQISTLLHENPMTTARYVLRPQPEAPLDDYIQAAIAAVTAIAGRPLDSLDAIPERLRYLFKDLNPPGGGPGRPDLIQIKGDAFEADEIGWLADLMRRQGGEGGTVSALGLSAQSATPAPTSPVDDEATVKAIGKRIYEYFIPKYNSALSAQEDSELVASEIVAAIRRGEVPGLPSPDEHAAIKAEVERLRAELKSTDDALCLWKQAENDRTAQRDAAIARAEKAEAELAKSEQAHMELAKGELFQIRTANQERDAARAAHAEAVQLVKRARRITDRWGLLEVGECTDWETDADAYIAKHGDTP